MLHLDYQSTIAALPWLFVGAGVYLVVRLSRRRR